MSRYPLNLPVQLKKEAEHWASEQGVSLNQFVLWAVADKVGSLRQMLDDPKFSQVTYRRGTAGMPTPFLRGTGIRVQTIVGAMRYWDMSPGAIASDYDLTKTQVREALDFYEAHHAEIDAAIAADESLEPTHA